MESASEFTNATPFRRAFRLGSPTVSTATIGAFCPAMAAMDGARCSSCAPSP